jgi:hypothetical protein
VPEIPHAKPQSREGGEAAAAYSSPESLRAFASWRDTCFFATLRQKFQELHDLSACGHTQADGTHAFRIAVNKLQTLDTIRIVEGKP